MRKLFFLLIITNASWGFSQTIKLTIKSRRFDNIDVTLNKSKIGQTDDFEYSIDQQNLNKSHFYFLNYKGQKDSISILKYLEKYVSRNQRKNFWGKWKDEINFDLNPLELHLNTLPTANSNYILNNQNEKPKSNFYKVKLKNKKQIKYYITGLRIDTNQIEKIKITDRFSLDKKDRYKYSTQGNLFFYELDERESHAFNEKKFTEINLNKQKKENSITASLCGDDFIIYNLVGDNAPRLEIDSNKREFIIPVYFKSTDQQPKSKASVIVQNLVDYNSIKKISCKEYKVVSPPLKTNRKPKPEPIPRKDNKLNVDELIMVGKNFFLNDLATNYSFRDSFLVNYGKEPSADISNFNPENKVEFMSYDPGNIQNATLASSCAECLYWLIKCKLADDPKKAKIYLGIGTRGERRYGCDMFIALYKKYLENKKLYYADHCLNRMKSLQVNDLFYSIDPINPQEIVFNSNNRYEPYNSMINVSDDNKKCFFEESDERAIELFNSNREDIIEELKPQFGQLIGGPLISDSLYKAIVFALKYYKFQKEYDTKIQNALTKLNKIDSTKIDYSNLEGILNDLNVNDSTIQFFNVEKFPNSNLNQLLQQTILLGQEIQQVFEKKLTDLMQNDKDNNCSKGVLSEFNSKLSVFKAIQSLKISTINIEGNLLNLMMKYNVNIECKNYKEIFRGYMNYDNQSLTKNYVFSIDQLENKKYKARVVFGEPDTSKVTVVKPLPGGYMATGAVTDFSSSNDAASIGGFIDNLQIGQKNKFTISKITIIGNADASEFKEPIKLKKFKPQLDGILTDDMLSIDSIKYYFMNEGEKFDSFDLIKEKSQNKKKKPQEFSKYSNIMLAFFRGYMMKSLIFGNCQTCKTEIPVFLASTVNSDKGEKYRRTIVVELDIESCDNE